MLRALSCQLIRQPTKSSRRSTISGCRSIASSAIASVFLLTMASTMPRRVSRLQRALKVDEGLADRVVAAEAQLLPADVADDAAPERVVEVDDDELARAP